MYNHTLIKYHKMHTVKLVGSFQARSVVRLNLLAFLFILQYYGEDKHQGITRGLHTA